jgi:hypothetical protein
VTRLTRENHLSTPPKPRSSRARRPAPAAKPSYAIGDAVHIFGKNHLIYAESDDGGCVQIVPLDAEGQLARKPHPFDWLPRRKLEARAEPPTLKGKPEEPDLAVAEPRGAGEHEQALASQLHGRERPPSRDGARARKRSGSFGRGTAACRRR